MRKRSVIRGKASSAVALVVWLLTACSSGQTDVVESRIIAVENSLLPAVINAGSEPSGMPLSERMRHYLVPGVSIAVINDGRVEWAKGYGVAEAGGSEPITADTVFQACSVSKPVSVTGIMLLAQSGAIDTARNVNDFLRSWHLADNAFTTTEKATIQRLMSHTAGINVSGFGGYPPGSTIPTLLQVLNGVPPANNEAIQVVAVPGSQFSYSGGGMEVLQQMAEDVTGTSFQTHMKNSVFSRLGMNSSDFVQPLVGSLAMRAAKGHDLDGNVLPGGWNTYPELIAAGLWTTSSDLARLLMEVQNAAATNTGALLTQQTAARILTQQPNSTMGLGFVITNGKGGLMFNHTGSNIGYKSYVAAYRDRGQGIAVMTNGESGISLLMEIVRATAKVYGWPDRFVEEVRLVELPRSVLQSYVGNYTATLSGQTLQAEIYLAGSTLAMNVATAGTGQRSDMHATAADTFLLRENVLVPGTLTFSRDGTSNVTGFSIALQAGGTIAATKN